MGIARFYRWLSERFPLINENITAEQIPDFDNLYVDMNGIIHNSSHNNTGGLCVNNEDEVFINSFKYIVRLVHLIRPRKVLYMAVDGCAPRAKMNQQRSRRFRAANDLREDREKTEEMGDELPENPFDSNCITPGTEFMARLTEALRFFVQRQINEDPVWQGITVVLSGPDVPGEGEHKIMDYIRSTKAQPDFDNNTRHCLYGLDADLIMLSLASHEPHFALLREEVVFGRAQTKTTEQRVLFKPDRFQLLHVSLLREYLELEFASSVDPNVYAFDIERVIDDFILFCVMVGNDFLPHLPFAEISAGGLETIFSTYKEHLRECYDTSPWLVKNCGEIDFWQFSDFLQRYAVVEEDFMDKALQDEGFKLGQRRLVGPPSAPDPPNLSTDIPEQAPTVEEARLHWYDVKFGIDIQKHEGTQQQRKVFHSYLEGLQWVLFYYFRGPDQCSWSWYYPYYHAPLIYDLAKYDALANPGIQFDLGAPFLPFQQLMAVLPAASKTLLPTCYRWLFDDENSPILHFYPGKFEIDIDGVKVPWGGVALIPFIDPMLLLRSMEYADTTSLSPAERKRNSVGEAYKYSYCRTETRDVLSVMPDRVQSVTGCHVSARVFEHPPLPAGRRHFPNIVLPGSMARAPGFPTLHLHQLTHTFETGVRVFQQEARQHSLIVQLGPKLSTTPDKEAAQQLLEAPYVQVDYPFVHHGKVVKVLSDNRQYSADGQVAARNPREHAEKLGHIAFELRSRGVTVNSSRTGQLIAGGTAASNTELLAEVQVAESRFVDSTGVLRHQFKSSTETRLVSLLRAVRAQAPPQQPAEPDRLLVGDHVLCIDTESPVFGQVGVVQRSEPVETFFSGHAPSGEQQTELQEGIRAIVTNRMATLKWHSMQQVGKLTGLEQSCVRQILGSLRFRGPDNVREDIGMSLMFDKPNQDILCLPGYSKKEEYWLFSDLAVEALRDYFSNYPSLFSVLRNRTKEFVDVEARFVFPEAQDLAYSARKLVKYCNKCPFKMLPMVPRDHTALPPDGIWAILDAVEVARKELPPAASAKGSIIRGRRGIYHPKDRGCRPPSELLPSASGGGAGSLALGQRGTYVKPQGLVPFGSMGTIVAIYKDGPEQSLELVLDEDSFAGTDLNGRSPAMRGARVAASDFMPLLPRLGAGGGAAETAAMSEAILGLLKNPTMPVGARAVLSEGARGGMASMPPDMSDRAPGTWPPSRSEPSRHKAGLAGDAAYTESAAAAASLGSRDSWERVPEESKDKDNSLKMPVSTSTDRIQGQLMARLGGGQEQGSSYYRGQGHGGQNGSRSSSAAASAAAYTPIPAPRGGATGGSSSSHRLSAPAATSSMAGRPLVEKRWQQAQLRYQQANGIGSLEAEGDEQLWAQVFDELLALGPKRPR